jgi:cell division protein FtsI/penicillin-binding protein 2
MTGDFPPDPRFAPALQDARPWRAIVASFIGFAPADHPTVAIAVVLAAPRGGFGGTAGAPITPIAARVIPVIRDVLHGGH